MHRPMPPRMPVATRRSALRALAAAALASAAGSAGAAPAGAPDFTLPLATGGNLRLLEQRGKVVMLNFWASWCGPCQREMPHLEHLYERYRAAGFLLLGINVDEDPRKADAVRNALGIRFPVLLDAANQVSRAYGLSAMPSSVLVDRDGRLRERYAGYHDGTEELYERRVRALLKE